MSAEILQIQRKIEISELYNTHDKKVYIPPLQEYGIETSIILELFSVSDSELHHHFSKQRFRECSSI